MTKAIFEVTSIFDSNTIEKLEKPKPEGYDIVHSWGVLHHTGNRRSAITHCFKQAKSGDFNLCKLCPALAGVNVA